MDFLSGFDSRPSVSPSRIPQENSSVQPQIFGGIPTASIHSQRRRPRPSPPPPSAPPMNDDMRGPSNPTAIVVSGFPLTELNFIENMFSEFGPFQDLHMKGNAMYIVYENPISAERALRQDGAWLLSNIFTFLIAVNRAEHIPTYPQGQSKSVVQRPVRRVSRMADVSADKNVKEMKPELNPSLWTFLTNGW